MSKTPPKSRISIPSPCTEDWGAMTGDATRRHCAQCNKHVHDLSAMTPEQAAPILATPGVCVRARLDSDGAVIHAPPSRSEAPRWLRPRAATRLLTLSAALFGVTPALAAPQAQTTAIPEATEGAQSDEGLMGWVRGQIRAMIDAEEVPVSQGEIVMGDIAVEPPPPPPPPPPPVMGQMPAPPMIMGRIAKPPPTAPPIPPPVAPPPVAPPPVAPPLPRPAPGESVIPEVEEALREQ